MRKAQSEILGLVMVVLLISVGLLIAILIFSKPSADNLRYEQDNFVASSFLNTLVKSDSSCKGRSVGELLQYCDSLSSLRSSFSCEDGSNACSKVRYLTETFLKEFFTDKGMSFYFLVSGSDVMDSFVFGSACRGEFESKTRPMISSTGSQMFIKLDICN